MTKLSVNLNKIATLRNARGGNIPNLLQIAKDVQKYGAHGITIHPRPDERHITYKDVYDLKSIVKTELNIEGRPINKFMNLVLDIIPNQVTLVPDSNNVITSNSGWDAIRYQDLLTETVKKLKDHGIRTSIFLDPNPKLVPYAANTGTDRIELYTGNFAVGYANKRWNCIDPYIITSKEAINYHLSVNAGHDLNLENISFFIENIPSIVEVSIGQALISDSLYMGLENTIQTYLKRIYKAYENSQI
ncbi:pyridoxine 5'-phosphate synthase [Blattabacterium cuenoti]|uniref:pyridoxine 5'-phosphate synthase n=1 Tax=Blattabacterium cuenoti TaxID=1653831 RepID=UPI00163BF664|nr:pyridoxine 5'-phosphate synthase [Blattabacterium cuenoti]